MNKIGIGASVVAAVMMSSCSDKGYWEEAPLVQAYSFEISSYSETLSPGANEIELGLVRTIADTESSVNLVFEPNEGCPSDISVVSPAVFAAGSFTTKVTVRIADANPPYTYSGTVKLANKDEVSYSGKASVSLNLPVAYTWTSIGNGTFYDAWVMDNATAPYSVEIMKADGFERYRVMSPYVEYYTTIGPESWNNWIASTGPAYVEFWETADGRLSFNSYNTGMNYQAEAGQAIGAYNWSAFAAGSYADNLDIWYEPGFAVLSPIYYINGVGGYGQQQNAVQIELP